MAWKTQLVAGLLAVHFLPRPLLLALLRPDQLELALHPRAWWLFEQRLVREPHNLALRSDRNELLLVRSVVVVRLRLLVVVLLVREQRKNADRLQGVPSPLPTLLDPLLVVPVRQWLRRQPLVERVGVLLAPRTPVLVLVLLLPLLREQHLLAKQRRALLDWQLPVVPLPAADVVAILLPVGCPHDPLEEDRPRREKELDEVKSLLVVLVDVLLARALHAVLRVALLSVGVVAWWPLL